MNVALQLSEEVLEAIARRAAALVLERQALEREQASPYVSIEEAAEFLRCKPRRVYDLRSSGRLASYSEGGRALVDRAELELLVVEDGLVVPGVAA